MRPGGRAAILTFHSGEDKLVKKALKQGYKDGIYLDYAKDVIRPSAQECAQNGRARSTKCVGQLKRKETKKRAKIFKNRLKMPKRWMALFFCTIFFCILKKTMI